MTKSEAVEKIIKECSNYDSCGDCPLYVKSKFTKCAIAVMIGVVPARWEDKEAHTVKIKPCPFCGGEAKIYVTDLGICVKCMNLDCRCQTEFIVDVDLDSCKKYNALEYAVKTWNRRAMICD